MPNHHDTLDDADLLMAVPQNPDAFAVFYRRHVDGVLAFFARRARTHDAAADLTAETFAAALLGCRRYRADVPPAPWLFAIAHNKWVDSERRGRSEVAARRKLAMEPVALIDDDLELIDALGSDDAMRFLGHLPPDQQQAIRMRILDEADYEDIAAELNCSQGAIRQRVSRGLHSLRTNMEHLR